MESPADLIFAFGLFILVVIIVNANERTKRHKSMFLKCPRCEHGDTRDKFPAAANQLIGCVLLCLFALPGILYFMWFSGKITCPKCGNVF